MLILFKNVFNIAGVVCHCCFEKLCDICLCMFLSLEVEIRSTLNTIYSAIRLAECTKMFCTMTYYFVIMVF